MHILTCINCSLFFQLHTELQEKISVYHNKVSELSAMSWQCAWISVQDLESLSDIFTGPLASHCRTSLHHLLHSVLVTHHGDSGGEPVVCCLDSASTISWQCVQRNVLVIHRLAVHSVQCLWSFTISWQCIQWIVVIHLLLTIVQCSVIVIHLLDRAVRCIWCPTILRVQSIGNPSLDSAVYWLSAFLQQCIQCMGLEVSDGL